jgi:hypothetical protein
MAKLLQFGLVFADEMSSGIGHVACTLGGVNYESRGGDGCLKGPSARGATNSLFRHHYFRVLTEDEGQQAKAYADACVGEPYVFGAVPTASQGGDCSGYMSGILCAIDGDPPRRLFGTGTWLSSFSDLGFHEGLGPAGAGFGREISLSRLLADIDAGRRSDDITAIKRALNRELGTGLKRGGRFGNKTRAAYSQWQQKIGLSGSVARVGSNADGLPGADSLERLGFLVVA